MKLQPTTETEFRPRAYVTKHSLWTQGRKRAIVSVLAILTAVVFTTVMASAAELTFSQKLARANAGNVSYQVVVAGDYQSGNGVEENHEEAFKWFLKAAYNGSSLGQYMIADLYCSGDSVVKPDNVEAYAWIHTAFKAHPQINSDRGTHQSGFTAREIVDDKALNVKIADFDAMLALLLTREELAAGTKRSQELSTQIARSRIDGELPFAQCLAKAEAGDATAQFIVGLRYANGVSVKQDDNEAVRWVTTAANNGNGKAQCALSELYLFGSCGVQKDVKEARTWAFVASFTTAQRRTMQNNTRLVRLRRSITLRCWCGCPSCCWRQIKPCRGLKTSQFAMMRGCASMTY